LIIRIKNSLKKGSRQLALNNLYQITALFCQMAVFCSNSYSVMGAQRHH